MNSTSPGALKGLMIILDGLGDRPVEQFGGQTPLEAAVTPNLDDMVDRGMSGMVRPIRPWVPVGTQVGTALLMGLAAADIPLLNRGPVEAAGAGLKLRDGDIALRCNFATLRENGVAFEIADRRAGRIDSGTSELAAAVDGMELFGGVVAGFRASTQHRAVLRLSGTGLSADITDTDPGTGNEEWGVQPCRPLDPGDAAAQRTAALVNEFVQRSHEVLDTHPVNEARLSRGQLAANGLLTRGAGMVMTPRNFVNQLGLSATLVTGEGTVDGLGKLFGFSVINKPEFTGAPVTDIEAKIEAARAALESSDLVFVHFKGPDVAAHDLNPSAKRDFIAKVDAYISTLVDENVVLAVTGDHTTDSTTGRHTGDAVPGVILARGSRLDQVSRFAESTCRAGALGSLTSTSFLMAMLDHMHVLHNYRGYEDDFIQ